VLGVDLLGVQVAVARGAVGIHGDDRLGWVWDRLLSDGSVVQVEGNVRLDSEPSFPRVEAALVGVEEWEELLVGVDP
jgi:hypothetical protein